MVLSWSAINWSVITRFMNGQMLSSFAPCVIEGCEFSQRFGGAAGVGWPSGSAYTLMAGPMYTAYSICSYQCHLKRQIWMFLRHFKLESCTHRCLMAQITRIIESQGPNPPGKCRELCLERCMEPWHVSPWAEGPSSSGAWCQRQADPVQCGDQVPGPSRAQCDPVGCWGHGLVNRLVNSLIN